MPTGILAAVPGITSILGGLFGKKSSGGTPVNTQPQWLTNLQSQLGQWSSQGLANFTPGEAYPGDLNFAGKPTSQEQSSLDQLTSYLGQPGTGGLFDQASGQIKDTLAGKFADPASSPFIQAMSKIANNNLNDQITQERGQRGARGTYYTTAGVQSEDKLRGRTLDTLNGIIGQFQQQERQNQLGAANTAQQLDQYQNQTVPLAKINAGQTYGSLSRLIDQANLESQYQDYLRQRTELQLPVKTSLALATGQPNGITEGTVNSPVTQSNNDFGNIMNLLPQILKIGGQLGIPGLPAAA